jgi:hypothetical protein
LTAGNPKLNAFVRPEERRAPLYQPPENLTPGGFANSRKRDLMQHVVDSWSGQHVGNRDYTQNLSVPQLRAAAARTANAKQARRLLAIAMGLDGSRQLAAQAGGMDRQTLRDWVIRSNADGLWRGSRTGPGLGAGRVWPKPSRAKWRSGWTALTRRPMAWCVGAGPTCIAAKFEFTGMSAASASC